jgi:hypothetical protein
VIPDLGLRESIVWSAGHLNRSSPNVTVRSTGVVLTWVMGDIAAVTMSLITYDRSL